MLSLDSAVGSGALVVGSSVFGEGSGQILLDNLACMGTEASLEQCRHNGYYSENCAHIEDVGVLCNNLISSSSGLPEKAATAVEPSSFGPRTGRFLVAGIVCTGMESNILDCFQTVTGFSDTCSSPELGVICSDYRAHVLNFEINAEARTVVTVAENSSVRMRCEAEGRPSPQMTIVSVSNDKQEVASRPRGAVQSPDQRVELTYDLTAAPCEAAGDYRCEVDNGLAEDRGVNVKVIIGAAVGTAAVLKSLSRHAEANTRQALETTVPLEDMKSSGATNNYYRQNTRSEVMNMPQEKDIMTEDLYVNTAELAREEYDSDHEYSDVDDIDSF
ncbi:hypothetical protein C0Q70_13027 [Pomacea canaliculata]|uniref:SRCR domain-containing protein n=1 Tax=Pomacea canaliculata TaxID=400727 RepID=A0A2T7P360_POMCA|nr:hypothetical protein C0Q70_13027 [Pomacea canaliculata]